ncbi:MAG: 50S ribosomal protein L21 [Defluviitaleaceae bacterium]|nr:50S ribosomal protein L21 [Defluviitaleaceae bacterium]
MYAIIETGGKQYKVQVGDEIFVEKLDADASTKFTFDRVLGLFDEKDDNKTVFGKPLVAGATVTAEILGDGKAKKIIVYKYKAKKGFHKKKGHRQPFTRVKIEKINE